MIHVNAYICAVKIIYMSNILKHKYNCILGVSSNDTASNSSILNGGIRARMRLHEAKHVAPSTFHGTLTSVYQNSTYNSGSEQVNANKNNEQIDSVTSNSLSNGHAISPADKSIVTLSGRSTAPLSTSVSTSGIVDGRIGTSSEQFPKVCVSESRNISQLEQSTVLPGTVGISRSDQLTVNTDICSHNRTEQSISNERNPRTESVTGSVSDSYGTMRADQDTNPLVDECIVSRVDQFRNSGLTDSQGHSQTEQSVVFTLPDGSHLEQPTVFLMTDGRGIARSDQSSILSMGETRRISHSEQYTNSTTTRSNPRVIQRVAPLTGQTTMIPGQSTQSESSIVLADVDPANHSEEPLPPGWEMRYDIYGRRLLKLFNFCIFRKYICSYFYDTFN